MIVSKSPYTDTEYASYEALSDDQVLDKINAGHTAFAQLNELSLSDRCQIVAGLSDVLHAKKAELAKLITMEMGKLYSESVAEIEKCAWLCDYYAHHAEQYLMEEIVMTDATVSKISYEPLGIILAVMPWNFPFWQVFRYAIPTILAGNTCLLKHASNVPQCALAIEEIFNNTALPENTFQTLLIKSNQVESIIAHRHVKAVTLTGSGPAGRAVAATAGSHLKKSVLELGGSDPYIILHDADVRRAAKICATGRMKNAGQSCIGAKRFIAVREVYDEFLSAFRKEIESYKFGDPMMTSTTLAPMSSHESREELHKQVLQAIGDGAHLLTGGYMSTEIKGAFYPPTILTEISPENSVFYEELFGPVAMVFRVEDEEEAIKLANDTPFGLGAAVFSNDIPRATYIAQHRIEAGSCFVNAQVSSDPRLPFGGINDSGYGRELSSQGIREFVNIKTVYVKS